MGARVWGTGFGSDVVLLFWLFVCTGKAMAMSTYFVG